MQAAGYVGRFAPSPTGRLHMGSLLAAVASWCDAKHHGGTWLVRMEDLDPPREVAGASDDILRTLEGHGLHWDGDVVFQSRRSDLYADALDSLKRDGCVFPCACSRK
ncbi:glutamate--tRNA ligase family protein, partial [bacterium]|nr:glutamate--tRNA ligase family protein [bacterium]